METLSKRIEFIDLAKGVCILLVVLGHVIEPVNEAVPIILCLRMPCYFCLSGLFFKPYNGFSDFLRRKLNKLFVPFVFFYMVSYVFYYLGKDFSGETSLSKFGLTDIFISNDIYNIPIWFLLCLFWINITFYFLRLILKNEWRVFMGVFLCGIVGYICALQKVSNPLYFVTNLTCMPFFYMGYLLRRTDLLYPSKQHRNEMISAILLITIGIFIAYTSDTPPRFLYYKNQIVSGNFAYIYICSASLVGGLLLVCKQIRKLPVISYFGRFSIIILCTHLLVSAVFIFIQSKLVYLGILENISYILNFVLVLSSMFFIIPFAVKYFPYIVAQKDLFTDNYVSSVKRKIKMLISYW